MNFKSPLSVSRPAMVAWFPRQKVLFGGCMILTGERVGNTSDADLTEWPNSLARLERFPAKWIIPGHGQKFTPGLIEHTREVLRTGGGRP